jgi:flagellar hook-length control protein FliK
VVIQISPLIETAYAVPAPESNYALGPQSREIESAEDRPEEPEEFAEILAGLLRNAGNPDAGTDPQADRLELLAAPQESAETGDTQTAALDLGKNQEKNRAGLSAPGAADQAEARKTKKAAPELDPEKAGPAKAENPAPDMPDEEKFIPGIERLLNHAAESPALADGQADEAALSGKALDPAPESGGLPAALARAAVEGSSPDAAQETVPAAEDITAAGGAFFDIQAAAGKPPAGKDSGEAAQDAVFAGFAETEQAKDKIAAQGDLRKGEKEGKTRLEETRARDKRRGVSVDVRDFRSGNAQNGEGQKTGGIRIPAGAETRSGADSRDITLELRLPNQGQEAPQAETLWEAKAGQAFEDLLARELHQNFNNDIVRHASMALRDNGEGTIRLALKPESLGNVKIRLEMAENKITGHIVVESEEALRAFEREIHSLEQAFKDSGFEGANLEMSLAADSRGAEQHWQGPEEDPFLTGQFAASRYEAPEWAEIPLTLIDLYQSGPASVNMLV